MTNITNPSTLSISAELNGENVASVPIRPKLYVLLVPGNRRREQLSSSGIITLHSEATLPASVLGRFDWQTLFSGAFKTGGRVICAFYWRLWIYRYESQEVVGAQRSSQTLQQVFFKTCSVLWRWHKEQDWIPLCTLIFINCFVERKEKRKRADRKEREGQWQAVITKSWYIATIATSQQMERREKTKRREQQNRNTHSPSLLIFTEVKS